MAGLSRHLVSYGRCDHRVWSSANTSTIRTQVPVFQRQHPDREADGQGRDVHFAATSNTVGEKAKIIFDGSTLQSFIQDTNRDWWNGGQANEFVLTNGADMTWFIFEPRPWWTLEVNEGTSLSVYGRTTYPGNLGASEHYGSWGGPLRINGNVFPITGVADKQGAWWLGLFQAMVVSRRRISGLSFPARQILLQVLSP